MIGPLVAAIEAQLGPNVPERIGVAVSGGGDSVALLAAVVAFAQEYEVSVDVITVDHGLRDEAKDEVRLVTDLCAQWDLPHHVEFWTGWQGEGNLQAEARAARMTLMSDWAYAHQITHILLGHTANDQAETVLMRLARAAGVDGLSAMQPRRVSHGITWVRPFLRIERAALRSYLRTAQINWIEDPSNSNQSFQRVRVRDALTVLGTLGVTVESLVQVAENMARAREALDWQTFLTAREIARVEAGAVVINEARYRTLNEEIARRLLVHALMWITGTDYPPRRVPVKKALEEAKNGRSATLHGCQITVQRGTIWVHREFKAVEEVISEVGDNWDDRWYVVGPEDDPDIEVRALGADGLTEIESWRDLGIPRAVLAVTPSVWYDGRLMAAPVARFEEEWVAELESGQDAFFAMFLSH